MKSKNTSKMLLLAVLVLTYSGGAQSAKCRFETQEADHVEARRVVLFRGATIGLQGYFGLKNDEYYLRGLFGSNFKGRAKFTTDTPLQLTLADGRTLTLDVVTETTSSKLKFGHIITVLRDAHPVYSITPEQWGALQKTAVVSLQMPFDIKEERRIEGRKVKGKHAQKIMAAIACVNREVVMSADAAPASEETD